jgi:hypothetical protein
VYSWYSSSAKSKQSTIKPERLPEPYLERGLVGGGSLTLLALHVLLSCCVRYSTSVRSKPIALNICVHVPLIHGLQLK